MKLKKGGTITIQLGKAPEKQNVPSVVGDDVADAKQTLEGSGFKVEHRARRQRQAAGRGHLAEPTGQQQGGQGHAWSR